MQVILDYDTVLQALDLWCSQRLGLPLDRDVPEGGVRFVVPEGADKLGVLEAHCQVIIPEPAIPTGVSPVAPTALAPAKAAAPTPAIDQGLHPALREDIAKVDRSADGLPAWLDDDVVPLAMEMLKRAKPDMTHPIELVRESIIKHKTWREKMKTGVPPQSAGMMKAMIQTALEVAGFLKVDNSVDEDGE